MGEEVEKKKRGRPSIGFGVKNKRFDMRFTEYEYEVIKNAAAIDDMPMSEFIRKNMFDLSKNKLIKEATGED